MPLQTKSAEKAGRTITLEELRTSLPQKKITAVFDVDDTVLFTSAPFYWGEKRYGSKIAQAGGSTQEKDLKTVKEKQLYREFWSKLNSDLDRFSIPKNVAKKLISLHQSRGDRIVFVTKRIKTKNEQLTATLKETFGIKKLEPVVFTNRNSKATAFKSVRAAISYGDSDGDIKDSISAGARPIRVLRARNSVNHDPVHNGAFGEDILKDSDL